jgi:hypothetical protein
MFEQNLQQKSEFRKKRFLRIFRKHPIFAVYRKTVTLRPKAQGDQIGRIFAYWVIHLVHWAVEKIL